MDSYIGALGSGTLRAMILLVVPGAIAVLPWFGVAYYSSDELKAFVDAHPSQAGSVLVILIMAAGMILTSLGSWIEFVWDWCRNRKGGKHTEDWYAYLRLSYEHEPVGHRYIRDMVLSLRFELSATPALIAGPGVVFLGFWPGGGTSTYGILAFACAAYLLFESWSTNGALGTVREQLLNSSGKSA